MTKTKLRGSLASFFLVSTAAAAVIAACGDPEASSGGETQTQPDAAAPETTTPPADGAAQDAGNEGAADEHTTAIGLGYATGCALSNKGRVKCWGDAVDGEFLSAPVQGKKCYQYSDQSFIDCDPRAATELTIGAPVIELSVGYLDVCAIVDQAGTRKLGCWGKSDRGSLTSAADAGAVVTSIVWVSLPSQPKHIVQGRNFKLVQLDDGSVWAWGDNRYGQYAGATLGEDGTPQKVFPFTGDAGSAGDAGAVREMAASYLDSFLLTDTGLFGVGDNSSAQLMMDPNAIDEVHAFAKLDGQGDAGVAKLFGGCGYSVGQCYITTSGKAYCWGDNNHGQVGATGSSLVDPVIKPQPVDLPGNRTVTALSVGSGQTCAVLDDGTVYCWGENDRGESGLAAIGDVYTPVQVKGVANAVSIAAGRAAATCALTVEHKILCWGDNSFGQLGSVPTDGGASSAAPLEVPLTW